MPRNSIFALVLTLAAFWACMAHGQVRPYQLLPQQNVYHGGQYHPATYRSQPSYRPLPNAPALQTGPSTAERRYGYQPYTPPLQVIQPNGRQRDWAQQVVDGNGCVVTYHSSHVQVPTPGGIVEIELGSWVKVCPSANQQPQRQVEGYYPAPAASVRYPQVTPTPMPAIQRKPEQSPWQMIKSYFTPNTNSPFRG
jgi:hypothetical protein